MGDRLPNDFTSEDLINGKTKTSQILDEIHYHIENLASNILVTGMNKFYYENVNQDSIVVCRGEFTIEIPRYTSRVATPYDAQVIDIGQNQTLCKPVTVIDPNNNTTTQVLAGQTYTVPLVELPVFEPAVVIDNVNGVTIELSSGETYTVNDIPDLYSMSFNYGVESESGITITATAEEAATYSAQALVNCSAVTYRKNSTVTTLPIALAVNDVLSVEITKNNLTASSKVVLTSL
ncbi:hypothetical protein [Rufibacter immobilis]|uniref:hypothetical protein n=1 Tax=Rufibacter immobilis TaxID=1348778 RepID=UPI0011CE63A0|nr:hypothetical protein [Rufibacter immobilis]